MTNLPEYGELIEMQLKAIDENGTEDVARLTKELEKKPNDWEVNFDLAMAEKQMAMSRNVLMMQKADWELTRAAETEEDLHPSEVDFSSSRPIFESALKHFEKAQELNPDCYGVSCQMGVIYGNLGDTEKAISCYKKALEEDDEDFSAAYYLGITYKDMGEKALAKAYLLKAQELNPDDEMIAEDLSDL